MNASHEPTGYELALLQFRPSIASDEAINIGVMAATDDGGSAAYRFSERYGRLTNAFPGLDGPSYRSLVRSLEARARDLVRQLGQNGQARLAVPSRFSRARDVFEAVLPPGGGTFRWSSPRFGLCEGLEDRVNEAFEEYVGRYEGQQARVRTDDEALWQKILRKESVAPLVAKLDQHVRVTSSRYQYSFRAGWTNGRRQVVEPISLDYAEPSDMVEEALRWRGRLEELNAGENFVMTALVTDPATTLAPYREEYTDALSVLRECRGMRAVFKESEAVDFAELVESDLAGH